MNQQQQQQLAASGANIYPPGVWFADVMTSFSGVTLVLFCFVFVFYAFIKAAALRSIVLRYAGAPIATRVLFLSFCLFGDAAFSEYCLYHCRFLFQWRVRRTFFPSGWCISTLWPRAGFFRSAYVRIQSINVVCVCVYRKMIDSRSAPVRSKVTFMGSI